MELSEIEKRLQEEFNAKYVNGPNIEEFFNKYTENGIGSKEVLQFPSTKLHRKLYPELYNFEFYGFSCYIERNFSAAWCGYVVTETNHPLWNNCEYDEYIENAIEVHGGITYINCASLTIGFDCSHYNDQEPFRRTPSVGKTYRTREFVINELQNMCKQLFIMLPKWSPITHSLFPSKMRKRYVELYKIYYLRSQSPILSKLIEKNLWIQIIRDAY